MARGNRAGATLLIMALVAFCAQGAMSQCKDGEVCDAKGKPCADKACVDCSDSYQTCKQCAGREARNTTGAYGEKDAYKPYALDASKGTCVACDPKGERGCDLAAGCTLVGGEPVCAKCTDGFFAAGDVEGGVKCTKCKGGCDDKGCDATGVCLGACAEGFTKTNDTCVPCKTEGCTKCSDVSKCEECDAASLLFLDDSGNCRSLDDATEWCAAAKPDGTCTACQQEYRLGADGRCQQCAGVKLADGTEFIGACLACPDAADKCANCTAGWRLDGGKCVSCNAADGPNSCAKCSATECLECGEGYAFDATNKTCAACAEGCLTCAAPSGACLSCYLGEPDAEGACPGSKPAPPCEVDGCELCAKDDAKKCELCEARTKTGFYSFVNGACVFKKF